MRNQLFVAAGVIGLLGIAWHFGQPKKAVVSVPKPVMEAVATKSFESPAEPPKPLAEGLDLSRAFNPTADEETSPLVLASFAVSDTKPIPIPVTRYRSLLIGVDTLNPFGLRLGWISVPLPVTDVLDIMPREIGK